MRMLSIVSTVVILSSTTVKALGPVKAVIGSSDFSNADLAVTSGSTVLSSLGSSVTLAFPLVSSLSFAPSPVVTVPSASPTVTPSSWVGAPGYAPRDPSQDTFYQSNYAASELGGLQNGQILRQRDVWSSKYSNLGSAYQVMYKTTRYDGSPTVAVTTVLLPQELVALGQRAVMFQNQQDSPSIDCSTSYKLLTQNAISEISDLLNQGWAVNVPDYLGSTSAYTASQLGGRLILDATRAMLRLNPTKNPEWQVAMWGYGTAASASGWAAELLRTYAPELNITTIALGGTIARLVPWLEGINGGVVAGNIPASLLGIASVYPAFNNRLFQYVIPRRRSQFETVTRECAPQYYARYLETDINEYFTGDANIFDDPTINSTYAANDLGKAVPSVPIVVYHGIQDTIASVQYVDDLVNFYCARGAPIEYLRVTGGHDLVQNTMRSQVIQYIGRSFNGQYGAFCGRSSAPSTTRRSSTRTLNTRTSSTSSGATTLTFSFNTANSSRSSISTNTSTNASISVSTNPSFGEYIAVQSVINPIAFRALR